MAGIMQKNLRTIENLRVMLEDSALRGGTATAIREKRDGIYQDISYSRLAAEAEALGTALTHRIPAGARVLLIGENSYAWALSFLALVCGAGVPVPVDAAFPATAVAAIAREAGATAVIYAPDKATHIAGLSGVVAVCMDELGSLVEMGKELLRTGETSVFETVIDRTAPAAVFFTSGTTGKPKGVLLSHANLCRTLSGVGYMANLTPTDTFLSVLPLSHAYECVLGFLVPLCYGAAVAFGEGLYSLGKNLREVHPTAMVLLPFLAEALYRKCWADISRRGAETAVRRLIAISDPVRPLAARQVLKEKLLARERAMFGGRLNRIFILGGHADAAVQKGLRQFGIFAVQGYGLTECAGLAALNCDESYKDGAAGKALAGGVLDIYNAQPDGSGEIRYKGENVMLGYLAGSVRESGIHRDGWFYTGDIGRIDADGFLYVIGRKQNAIETANGKRICPEELEALLSQNPFIREAVVLGVYDEEKKDNVAAAFICPDFAYAKNMFGEFDWMENLDTAISEWVEDINAELPPFERISMYALREEPFARNASGKVLRAALAKEFSALGE